MGLCTGIFQGQGLDCQNPLSVGLVQRALVANREDVELITYDLTPGLENVITNITMKVGTAFYEFLGVNQSINTQNELVKRATSNGYKHSLGMSVFEVDNVSLQNMQAMAYKPQIAIVYGHDDTSYGNGAFQCLGVEAGLELQTNVRINQDVETGGAHVLALATNDTGGDEKTIPPVIFNTDYTITLAIINALLIPAV